MYSSPVRYPRPTEPETISRSELVTIALSWGIIEPIQKSEEKLTREIWECQYLQKIYDRDGEDLEEDFPINSKREINIKWKDGIQLREDGLDFDTMLILIKEKIPHIRQLKTLTAKQLEESFGISKGFSTIISNKYSLMEKPTLSQNLERLNIQEKNETFAQQQAKKRLNRKKWPNRDRQTFSNFIKSAENDLMIIDSSKSSWINDITVLLEEEARELAQRIKEENPFMEYDEWKKALLNSTLTKSELCDALYIICQRKWDTKSDPRDHFKRIENALQVKYTKVTNEIKGLALIMSLPYYVQNKIIPKNPELGIEEIKNEVNGMWQESQRTKPRYSNSYSNYNSNSNSNWRSSKGQNEEPSKSYQDKTKTLKCDSNTCRSTLHKEEDCWAKHPEKRPKRDQNKANNVEYDNHLSDGSVNTTRLIARNKNSSEKVRHPMIKFKINNVEIEGMFDTGACTSLISKELAVKLSLLAYPYKLKFQSANKNIIHCEWFVPLKVFDGSDPKIVAAYVIDDLANDILLGENIIKATKLIIVANGLGKPYSLKHQNLNQNYELRIEIPKMNEIKTLLFNWYKNNYNLNKLHKMNHEDLINHQQLSQKIDESDEGVTSSTDHQSYQLKQPFNHQLDHQLKQQSTQQSTQQSIKQFNHQPKQQSILQINSVRINYIEFFKQNYEQNSDYLINRIEEFQDVNIDLPEEITNMNEKLYQQINPELTHEDRDKIYQVLLEAKSSFSANKFDLGLVPSEFTKFKIDIGNNSIPKSKPFRSSELMKKEIRKIIKEFKENGIIEDSDVGGGAPAFVVPKPNGTWRMVTSYVELNKLVQKRKFPMPNIDDALDQLRGNKYFTQLDLCQGYYQLEIPEEERDKTSFVTEDGCYRYKRLPMGLADAPSYFQEVINKVLGELKYTCCFGYFDDIVIYGKTINQLCDNMKRVIGALKVFGFKNRVDKLKAGATEIICLGHLVSGRTIRPDPKKIERIKNLNPPSNQNQVRSHLGLFNYFSRFVENYAKLAAPLQELVKKKYKGIPLKLEGETLKSWKSLKSALTQQCMLTHFYPNRETVVLVDASAVAIGGILTQKDENGNWNPVYFFGCKLQKYMFSWQTTEKECAAVVYACRKFAHFLRHKKFIIKSDHHALCELKNTTFKVPRIMRWQHDLSEFDFEVQYLKGEAHPADCFSRSNEWAHRQKGEMADDHFDKYLNFTKCEKDDVIIEDMELKEENQVIEWETQKYLLHLIREFDYLDPQQEKNLIAAIKQPKVQKNLESELQREQEKDTRIQLIKQEIKNGKLQKQYEIRDNILFKLKKNNESRYYLPDSLIDPVFKQYHEAIEAGHFGFKPTIQKIKQDFWFPEMNEIIQQKIAACEKCQIYKSKTFKEGKSKGMKVADNPMERIQIDMIGPFTPSTTGNTVVLVAADTLTRFGMARPFKKGNSKDVINFLETIINQYGCMRILQSDNGKIFTSNDVKRFAEMNQITLINSTPYHPQTNGLVERLNREIKTRMGIYTERADEWDIYLQKLMFSYNNSIKSELGKSPFQLLHGYEPRSIIHNRFEINPKYKDPDVSTTRKEIKEKLEEISQKSANERNLTQKEPNLKRGDLARVKPVPYTTGPSFMKHKFSGKYIVLDTYDSTARLICVYTKKIKSYNYERIKKIIGKLPDNYHILLKKNPSIKQPNQIDESHEGVTSSTIHQSHQSHHSQQSKQLNQPNQSQQLNKENESNEGVTSSTIHQQSQQHQHLQQLKQQSEELNLNESHEGVTSSTIHQPNQHQNQSTPKNNQKEKENVQNSPTTEISIPEIRNWYDSETEISEIEDETIIEKFKQNQDENENLLTSKINHENENSIEKNKSLIHAQSTNNNSNSNSSLNQKENNQLIERNEKLIPSQSTELTSEKNSSINKEENVTKTKRKYNRKVHTKSHQMETRNKSNENIGEIQHRKATKRRSRSTDTNKNLINQLNELTLNST